MSLYIFVTRNNLIFQKNLLSSSVEQVLEGIFSFLWRRTFESKPCRFGRLAHKLKTELFFKKAIEASAEIYY
jgi:hypothetical protein